MKSFKKSVLALGLAAAVIAAIGGANVFAAQTQTATVGGYGVYCKSDIKYRTATAFTEYGSYADTLSVESRYNYCNTTTGKGGSKSNGTGHYKRASLSFSAPTGCKSVSISSTHRVSAGGQNWHASTFDDKEA